MQEKRTKQIEKIRILRTKIEAVWEARWLKAEVERLRELVTKLLRNRRASR